MWLTMCANIITILYHLPVLQDFDHWALHTDAACLVFIFFLDSSSIDPRHVVRYQMIIFYAASGVWKLNYAFLDPQLSCGSVYLMQLLCGWLPVATSLCDRCRAIIFGCASRRAVNPSERIESEGAVCFSPPKNSR